MNYRIKHYCAYFAIVLATCAPLSALSEGTANTAPSAPPLAFPFYRCETTTEGDTLIERERFAHFVYLQERHFDATTHSQAFREQHLWPLWSHYEQADGSRFSYFPSPLGPWSTQIDDAHPFPFYAFYTYHRHPNGEETQSLFFHLIESHDSDEAQSLRVGPLLTLSNPAPNAPRVEILSGLISLGHSRDGRTMGLSIMGLNFHTEVPPPTRWETAKRL